MTTDSELEQHNGNGAPASRRPESVARGTLLLSAAQAAQVVAHGVIHLVAADLLPVEAYGRFAVVFLLIIWFGIGANSVIMPGLRKIVSEDALRFRAALTFSARWYAPLLAASAAVNKATSDDGATPLFIAAEKGFLRVARVLLEAGAAVDQATTDDGTAPLFAAPQNGHSAMVRMLLNANADVNKKAMAVLEAGMRPIVCIGETLEQREDGSTEQVLRRQLQQSLKDQFESLREMVIAYEPVWAIGTGLSTTPEQAQEVHSAIRRYLCECDAASGPGVALLYGGSVKADNAADLLAQADINGALVGGAALDADAFATICQAAVTAKPA